ncbi:MAG: polysaccharide biosynthesis protein [Anaerolineae bacterium]|nr:polysaccharide biosynthesis protein [Anaerolineae bacterium]
MGETIQYQQLYQRGVKHLKRIIPLVVADVLILFLAYLISYSIRAETVLFDFGAYVGQFIGIAVGVTIASLYIFGGYRRIWSRTSGHDVQVIVLAVLTAMLILTVLDLIFAPRPLPLSVVWVANLMAMTGLVAVRYRSRLITGVKWRWRAVWRQQFPLPAIRVLIVGAGDAGQTTAWRLKYRAPKGQRYQVVGFVDDDATKQNLYIEGCRVLGPREAIPRLVAAHNIELIVVAIHNIDGLDFREVLSYCETTSARIKIVPDVFAMIDGTNGVSLLRDVKPEDLLGRQPVEWHKAVDVSAISNRVTLVTGAAGSIGSELCRQLVKYNPVKLILVDNNESGLHDLVTELRAEQPQVAVTPYLIDITNRKMLNNLFADYRPQVVFHSAAYKHVPMLEDFPNEAVRVNIGGTQQVAGLARDFGAERFVLISTDKAVNPSCVMGASKRVCELLMHALSQQTDKTLFTSVRFGNVLGSRGSVVPTFERQIEAGGPVTVTDKEMTRYFMSIPEAANLVIHAACLTKGDDLFMLRMGEVVKIVDLAERMIRLRGLVPHKDISIEFTGMRPGEKLHEELHSMEETTLPTIHPYIIELVSRRNGLQPVSFSDRLNQLFQRGLDENRNALEQLREVIALGEHQHIEELV